MRFRSDPAAGIDRPGFVKMAEIDEFRIDFAAVAAFIPLRT